MTEPVGLVHDWLTGQRGGENVLRAIARLFPRAPIYTLFHFPGSVDPELERHRIVTSFLQRAPRLDPHYRWYLPLFPAGAADLPVDRHELVVSSSHCVVKSVRKRPGALHVCYCHTPMRYAWDQEQAYFGGRSGPLSGVRSLVLAGLRRWDAATAGRVDQYLANSTFVAERIRRYYGRSAEVVPPPVEVDRYTPPAADRPRGHALMVAALAPYKKVDLAIQACARAAIPLVVVGTGPERARLERLAGPNVRLAGRVDADELVELYRSAALYLQPGIEDFGIATVEAMACGTPVVALRAGGVLDIVRDGRDGLLYEGDEPAAVAAAIDKLRSMQFNSLEIRERAEGFSAERFARRFEDRIRSVWTGWTESEESPA